MSNCRTGPFWDIRHRCCLGHCRKQTATVIVKRGSAGGLEWEGEKGTKRNMRSGRGEGVWSLSLSLSPSPILSFSHSLSFSLALSPRSGPIPAYRLATGRKKIKSKDQDLGHRRRRLYASEPRQRKGGRVLEYYSTQTDRIRLTLTAAWRARPASNSRTCCACTIPRRKPGGGQVSRQSVTERQTQTQTQSIILREICVVEPMIDGQPCLEIV